MKYLVPTRYETEYLYESAGKAANKHTLMGDALDRLYRLWLQWTYMQDALERFESYGHNEYITEFEGWQYERMQLEFLIQSLEGDLRHYAHEVLRATDHSKLVLFDLTDSDDMYVRVENVVTAEIRWSSYPRTTRRMDWASNIVGLYGLEEVEPNRWMTPELGSRERREAEAARLVEAATEAATRIKQAAQAAQDVLRQEEDAHLQALLTEDWIQSLVDHPWHRDEGLGLWADLDQSDYEPQWGEVVNPQRELEAAPLDDWDDWLKSCNHCGD